MGSTEQGITVNLAVSGSATSVADFTALGTSITLGATHCMEYLEVEALLDSLYDPDETVIVTLQTGSGYSLDAQYSATVTIADTAPEITVAKISDTAEGASPGVVRFARSGPNDQALVVSYSLSGTATSSD